MFLTHTQKTKNMSNTDPTKNQVCRWFCEIFWDYSNWNPKYLVLRNIDL